MLSHAVFKGLFWLVTAAIILRTGKTQFKDMGGLAEKMPYTFAMGMIAVLSLAGIPPRWRASRASGSSTRRP